MFWLRLLSAAAASALLVACSSGGSPDASGGGGATPTPTPAPTPTPTPTPTPGGCSLRERQNWAAAQLDEWYLFPETLPSERNPGGYSSVEGYVDALTTQARAQGRDRYFTYVTSIQAEDAYYESGGTAGFGLRLRIDAVAGEVLVADVYDDAPAARTSMRRGTMIEAIGTSAASLRSVSVILASEGEAGVYDALGASQPGISRVFRYRTGRTEPLQTVEITKQDFDIRPIPAGSGVQVIEDRGELIGYLNLRSFISPAEPQMISAFANFRARGVKKVIIDLRYNGGGLIQTAELLGDLLGGGRSAGDVQNYVAFRPSKSRHDETRRFTPRGESITPTRIAFLVTGDSASASELIVNSMTPWLRENSAIIGSNTYGKPVGQIGVDRAACDDRLRVVALAVQNADRQGDYFHGLAGKTGASCQAVDEIRLPMGDRAEPMTAMALQYLRGESCAPIEPESRAMALRSGADGRPRPQTPAQRYAPGSF